ncbi:alpha/beta hydrolase, partial [archaeon]|nr:alpha/beta hydrolase [archaeon]
MKVTGSRNFFSRSKMRKSPDTLYRQDPFREFRRKRISLFGTSLHILQRGDGPDLLFLHGAPGSIRDWTPVTELLPAGFRITIFDRPGYGESGLPVGPVNLAYNCALVHELVMSLELRNPIVVGHSYGASIALALAYHRGGGEFAGFVGVAGPAFGYSHALFSSRLMALPLVGRGIASLAARLAPEGIVRRQIERALGPEAYAVDEDFFASRIREFRHTGVLSTFAQEEVRLDRDLKDLSAHYCQIDAPFTIVQGEHDVYVTVTEALQLKDSLPNGRLYL